MREGERTHSSHPPSPLNCSASSLLPPTPSLCYSFLRLNSLAGCVCLSLPPADYRPLERQPLEMLSRLQGFVVQREAGMSADDEASLSTQAGEIQTQDPVSLIQMRQTELVSPCVGSPGSKDSASRAHVPATRREQTRERERETGRSETAAVARKQNKTDSDSLPLSPARVSGTRATEQRREIEREAEQEATERSDDECVCHSKATLGDRCACVYVIEGQ